MSEQQVRGRVSGCYLDVGESGVSVGEVDPARDAVEVGLGDDVHELVDAPRGVDVLDVGLVLAIDEERFGNISNKSILNVSHIKYNTY